AGKSSSGTEEAAPRGGSRALVHREAVRVWDLEADAAGRREADSAAEADPGQEEGNETIRSTV
ncbi:MAG: hypothetical protein P8Z37_10415, partial [Acidobacteriota bacterium]